MNVCKVASRIRLRKSKDLRDFFIIILACPSKITFTTNSVVYTFSISFHTNHLQRFAYSIYMV